MKSFNKIRSHRNRPSEQGNCGLTVVRAGNSFKGKDDAHTVNSDLLEGVCADGKRVFTATPLKKESSKPAARSSSWSRGLAVSNFSDRPGFISHRSVSTTFKVVKTHYLLKRPLKRSIFLHKKICGCKKCYNRKNMSGKKILINTQKYGFSTVSKQRKRSIADCSRMESSIDEYSRKHLAPENVRILSKKRIRDSEVCTNLFTSDENVVNPCKKSKLKNAFPYNSIRIYGVHNVKTEWDFLRYCELNGIRCIKAYIRSFTWGGYKSKKFDSRSFSITFVSTTVAEIIHTDLCNKNIRCICFIRKQHSKIKIANKYRTLSINTDEIINQRKNINKPPMNHIRIGTWNIQSINKKSSLITNFMKENEISILALTETRWSGVDINLSPEYTWFGVKTQNAKSGGVGFLVDSSVLTNRTVKLLHCKNKNMFFILINGSQNTRATLFGAVYGPASPKKDELAIWWQSLQDELTSINIKVNKSFDTVLMGDFNSRIGMPRTEHEKTIIGRFGESKRCNSGRNAIRFMDANNMICLNNRTQNKNSTNYTYHQQGKIQNKSIIDLILISKGMYRQEYKAIVKEASLTGHESHYPVIADIRFTRKIPKTYPKFKISTWNVAKLKESKHSTHFIANRDSEISSWLTSFDPQNNNPVKFTNIFNKVGTETIGKIQKTYLNKGGYLQSRKQKLLKSLKRKYTALLRMSTSSKSDKNITEANNKLKSLRKRMDQVKKTQRVNELKRIAGKINKFIKIGNSKGMFETAKKFAEQKHHSDINALRDETGIIHTDTAGTLEILRRTWKKCFSMRVKHRNSHSHASHRFLPKNMLCYNDISYKEIQDSLSDLKNGKAVGIDKIPPEFLTDASDVLICGLQKLFNSILKIGIFPPEWKVDRRTPIFKKGSKLDPNNYRPIAVHSVFRKLFCKILHDRVQSIVQIHENQYGFMKEKRCSDHAAFIRDQIIKFNGNKKLGELFIALFDFEKAFDSCDHEILTYKLREHGVTGPLINIIESLYSNAKSCVYLKGKYSDTFNVERGVAQGCKLSTLLFNVYINDLLAALTPISENNEQSKTKISRPCVALCYADDLIVVTNSRYEMMCAIRKIERWCEHNLVNVNAKKSKIMYINTPEIYSNFKINGNEIPRVNEFKYLGFIISDRGACDSHITHSINKVRGLTYHWKNLLQCNDIPYYIRLRLADSMIISHLTYGEEIFTPNATLIRKMQSAENLVHKIIFNLPRHTHTAGILHLTGRLSTETRLRLRRLTNHCRVSRYPLNNFKEMFNDSNLQSSKKSLVHQTMLDWNCITKSNRLRNSRMFVPDNLSTDLTHTFLQCKSILRRQTNIQNRSNSYRSLLNLDEQHIAQMNSSIPETFILSQKGMKFNSLIAWKLGITTSNNTTAGNSEPASQEYIPCVLCDTINKYPLQQHLLTECPATIHIIQKYYDRVHQISAKSFKRLISLESQNQWIWILRAGEFCRETVYMSNHPITEGSSVSPGIDKSNYYHNVEAIMEHRAILKEIPNNSIIAYTDGSKIHEKVGAGGVIYYNTETIAELSFSLENCENNFAELYAIYKSLKYIQRTFKRKMKNEIHIFTDSRYSIDVLTMATHGKQHVSLINRIIAELSTRNSPKLVMHWIPSHVSFISNKGKEYIEGNEIADILAKRGAEECNNKIDANKNFIEIPQQLYHAAATLTLEIDNMTRRVGEQFSSQPIGPSSDDFSLANATQYAPMECVVTSSDV